MSIAYWAIGEGEPLVYLWDVSHIQIEWGIPEIRKWYERLAQGRMLVRFDRRGRGLSDRSTPRYAPGSNALDIDAVVARLGLDKFTLFAEDHSGPDAISYTVSHPEHVSKLILWCTYAQAKHRDVFSAASSGEKPGGTGLGSVFPRLLCSSR